MKDRSNGLGSLAKERPVGALGFVCTEYKRPHRPHGVCDGDYWYVLTERPQPTKEAA